MIPNNEDHSIRRIVLPSGRFIEVVRFSETDTHDTRELHICPVCNSDLVQPVEWAEDSETRWQLTLECPNCLWLEHGVYDRHLIEDLEDRLDEGLAEMIGDLQRLAQANMVDDIERFVAALHADQILPEDF